MPTTDHLRWHLALAVGGALLVERLHGQFAAALILAIVADRVVTLAVHRLRSRPTQPAADPGSSVVPGQTRDTRPARSRSVELTRWLGADCGTCRGFGCRTCAYTGLG